MNSLTTSLKEAAAKLEVAPPTTSIYSLSTLPALKRTLTELNQLDFPVSKREFLAVDSILKAFQLQCIKSKVNPKSLTDRYQKLLKTLSNSDLALHYILELHFANHAAQSELIAWTQTGMQVAYSLPVLTYYINHNWELPESPIIVESKARFAHDDAPYFKQMRVNFKQACILMEPAYSKDVISNLFQRVTNTPFNYNKVAILDVYSNYLSSHPKAARELLARHDIQPQLNWFIKPSFQQQKLDVNSIPVAVYNRASTVSFNSLETLLPPKLFQQVLCFFSDYMLGALLHSSNENVKQFLPRLVYLCLISPQVFIDPQTEYSSFYKSVIFKFKTATLSDRINALQDGLNLLVRKSTGYLIKTELASAYHASKTVLESITPADILRYSQLFSIPPSIFLEELLRLSNTPENSDSNHLKLGKSINRNFGSKDNQLLLIHPVSATELKELLSSGKFVSSIIFSNLLQALSANTYVNGISLDEIKPIAKDAKLHKLLPSTEQAALLGVLNYFIELNKSSDDL
jgi:hypothetical protein